MNDDFEFVRDMDEQVRQGRNHEPLLDAVETSSNYGLESDFEERYDDQKMGDMQSVFSFDLTDEAFESRGGTVDEPDSREEETDSQFTESAALPVGQEELNTLVANVTELGVDESVLGKERLLEAFHEAEDSEAKGRSYVNGFTSAVQRMLGINPESDPVEVPRPVTAEAERSEETSDARERFQHHKERYEAQFETVSPWPRDTVSAYHRMAMTYNAYVSGEKINGMEVSKIDVFLSGVRFYQSNIFETAIIRALRFAGDLIKEKYAEDKVDTDQTATEKEQAQDLKLKDDVGGYDHGDASGVSAGEVKSIRQNIREYGFDYGIDTTKGLDYNSTDNIRIYRPTDYVGRMDTGPGQTRAIPGVRIVEIDGNRALVTPDGKVVHENTRFQTGDGFRPEDYARIEYRCDALESRTLKEEITHMAQIRGVSVETIKAEYAEKAMDAYAARVEKTMLGEADRLEHQTIPEAREELNSLREDMTKLDRIESSLEKIGNDEERGLSSTEVSDLKSSLQKGIDTLDTRISAMEHRVELLRDTHAQVDTSTVKDRFERAANTEEQAVGRGGRIEYIASDVDKRLADVIDAGTDRIMGDVDRFNQAHPDMQLTYDADSGELYNHFGVSDSGNFNPEYSSVDANDLPKDSPDAIRDYISEHAGDDFEQFQDLEISREAEAAVGQEPSSEKMSDVEQEHADLESEETSKQTTAEENEETEAKVLAGHDDMDSEPVIKDAAFPENVQDNKEREYGDTVKELFSEYLNDSEGTVSLEEDIQSPLVDLTHDAGKEDFHEAMDVLSDMVMEIAPTQMEQLDRIADLVHAVADISPVPADAIDSFQDSIHGSDFASELIEEIGKPEITLSETEAMTEAQVTLGEERLMVDEYGMHDAITGDAVGGFESDAAADQYLDAAEPALFDSPADVEIVQPDTEVGAADNQQKFETFHEALDEISGSDTVEDTADSLSRVESGIDAAGLEAGEAVGDAVAEDAAIEAGLAGSAALL